MNKKLWYRRSIKILNKAKYIGWVVAHALKTHK